MFVACNEHFRYYFSFLSLIFYKNYNIFNKINKIDRKGQAGRFCSLKYGGSAAYFRNKSPALITVTGSKISFRRSTGLEKPLYGFCF